MAGQPAGNTEGRRIRNGLVVGYGQKGNEIFGLRRNLCTGTVDVGAAGAVYMSVNRSGDIGAVGSIIRSDGRVVRLHANGVPLVLTDNGDAAGVISGLGLPVVWKGC